MLGRTLFLLNGLTPLITGEGGLRGKSIIFEDSLEIALEEGCLMPLGCMSIIFEDTEGINLTPFGGKVIISEDLLGGRGRMLVSPEPCALLFIEEVVGEITLPLDTGDLALGDAARDFGLRGMLALGEVGSGARGVLGTLGEVSALLSGCQVGTGITCSS